MTHLKKVATNHWRLLDSYKYKVLRSLQVAPKDVWSGTEDYRSCSKWSEMNSLILLSVCSSVGRATDF